MTMHCFLKIFAVGIFCIPPPAGPICTNLLLGKKNPAPRAVDIMRDLSERRLPIYLSAIAFWGYFQILHLLVLAVGLTLLPIRGNRKMW
jgi:hypothetical protein